MTDIGEIYKEMVDNFNYAFPVGSKVVYQTSDVFGRPGPQGEGVLFEKAYFDGGSVVVCVKNGNTSHTVGVHKIKRSMGTGVGLLTPKEILSRGEYLTVRVNGVACSEYRITYDKVILLKKPPPGDELDLVELENLTCRGGKGAKVRFYLSGEMRDESWLSFKWVGYRK